MEEKNLERQKRKEEQKKKKMEKFAEKMKNIEKQPVKKSEKVSKSKNVPEKQTVKSVKLKQPKEKGEMKDLSGPMGQFDPIEVEYGWYDWWEKQKLFKPETIKKFRDDVKSPYVIPIPPPNVTGKLHIGHSMMIAIQDAIARFKRMQGHEVLYVPGTDHAGIATQTVVERKLYTKLGKTRHNLGRDAFLDEVWKWKEQYGNNIIEQIKRMGTSVDMDRFAFTLDDQRYEAVIECFVRLFEQGYIYRENRLVNWSSKLSTAISDLEIEYKDIEPHTKLQVDGQSYMFGVLYYVKYPIISKKISDEQLKLGSNLNQTEFIEIATTRPETILGDTAICVNPKDEKCEKYKDMVAINPLTHEPVKIIFDEFANLEFGTGKLKITPAHDFNDFEIGNKHNLETIRIFDENNKIIIKGAYFGMKRFDARLKVVENLKENGLFLKEEGYKQTLPFCSRSGDILEPLIKKQWWMKCKEFADKAIDSVKNEEIKLYPESATVQWNHWLTNIRDWCLSRQLWWGHRIPAYRVFTSGESEKLTRYSGESDNPTGSSGENHNPTGSSGERKRLGWVVARNKDEALEKATKQYNTLSKATLCVEQDEDVLDTWFSSAFWPFSIMGWPTETDDFKKYFPASILETGSDILFFWVARMVMASFAIFDKPPFEKILLHGIVRDANGRKMSKSLGNVVDPIHVIEGVSLNTLKETVTQTNLKKEEIDTALDSQEKDFPNGIPRCGTDALRFALCSYTSGLKDINLNILRVEGYRKFANKIWNAYKFINMQFENKLTKKTHDYMKDSARSFYTKYFTNAGSHPDYLKDNILEKLDQLSIKEKKKSTKSENTYSSSDSIVISDSGVIEWLMLHRNALIQEYTIEMESFNFMVVTQKVHQFIISIFCDIFIEITKKTECVEHLMACLFIFKDILLLLHPFMPFLTEELFQRMRNLNLFDNLKHSIVIEEFPTSSERIFVENDFSQAIQVVKAMRSLIDAQNTGKQSDSKKTYKVIMNKPEIVFFSKQIKTLCKKIETVEYSKIIECDITEKIDDMIFGIVEK